MIHKSLTRFLVGVMLVAIFFPSLPLHAAVTNLIANPSAETPDAANSALPASWNQGNWGQNTALFTYSNIAEDGNRGLSLTVTNYSNGDAKWYFTPTAVTAGTSYDFSDYYQSDTTSHLVAQYTTSAGANSYVDLATVPAATVWQQAKATFTAPAGVSKLTIFHLLSSNGSLTIDNASLAPSSTVVPTPTPTPITVPPVMVAGNLVPNPGVEQAGATAAAPNSWVSEGWGSNTSSYSYLSTGHSSSHSLQVTVSGYASGDAKWDFTPQTILPGQLYDVSDWFKATVTSHVVVAIKMADGTTQYIEVGAPVPNTSWTQFKGQFVSPAGAQSVTVMHLIAANGTLTTDDYTLAPDPITVSNGIPNPSFEQASFTNANLPSGWRNGGWGTNTATYTYLATGHTGTHSAKVQISSFTSGDAVWAYAPQAVQGGGRYRFTDWYISNRISEVELQMVMNDGTIQYLTIGHPGVASTWAKFSTVVNLPVGVIQVSALHLIAGVGTLTTDDYGFVAAPVIPFARPLVSVTFDDGWATQNTNGLPLLTQYHIPATFYLISGSLNATDYMTTAQVKALQAAGDELASHTITHPDLTTLSATKLKTELQGSQLALQQMFGGTFSDFASPYGTYNLQTITAIKTYYASHRSTDAGYNTKDDFDRYNLKVQNIDINTSEAMVDGWLAEAKQEGAWLILVFHQVDPNVDPVNHLYNTTPVQLGANLNAIVTSGITPVTISQGLSETLAQ